MTIGALPPTMKAVVLEAPYKIAVKDVPTPTIQKATDVIVQATVAGLCGSDLHIYRGHIPLALPLTIGHEMVGKIVQVGDEVTKWKVGDNVIVPFTATCGNCYFCKKGLMARCDTGITFGTGRGLDGCQAEYLRVPTADTFLFPQPDDIPASTLLLMADILPTGYFVASGGKRLLMESEGQPMTGDLVKDVEGRKEGVCVVIGCGPVGLCAISSAVRMFDKVFATDLAPHRLEAARRHGAIALPEEELKAALMEATEGRGADVSLEVVGHADAVLKAIELTRFFGVVSSCGVHSGPITTSGYMMFSKGLRFQWGQCSVPTYFPGAMEVLRDNKELFSHFIEKKIDFSEAEEYYTLFEKNKIGKTVFVMGGEKDV
ncbi:hypothetical protein CspeluHIS016_0402930 [Cutaneotrichosporon spelunceum]|uniref:GroES-like protein n=1 Tax=Cutaneotrichosporon spelunceum TaxID=1672016 RepID=A0AAD3YD24_9TREE|nr:hypothetical protein CspeluHIS016_0402930 [Cutaneotrichosporon spelunceum]